MAFRSFTLNLSIILCKYFLKACATMTLISQFKSKFKTDCKAMSYVLAGRLPHFIFEHLRRQIKKHSPRAQPAVCQIFKYPGMQKKLSDFPTSKLATTPYFSHQFLAHLHAFTQARLTHSAKCSFSLAHSPLRFPDSSNWLQSMLQNGSQLRQNHGGEFSYLCFLEVDLKEGLN